jgi:hypothetical protein
MGRDQGGRMRRRICRGDMDRRGEGEGVFRVVVGWSVVVYECPSAVESSGSGSGRGGEARARAVPASEVWLWFSLALALALLHVLDKTKDRLCLFFLTLLLLSILQLRHADCLPTLPGPLRTMAI